MQFFFEVTLSGLLSGLMYSLVALGFVLIYKASGVFNFAQGAMVYFAALAVVGLMDKGWPMWAAIIGAFAVMVVVAVATERLVLRKLVNQPPITLFMATIGLAFFLEGLGPMLFGSEVRAINLGIVDEPIASVMDSFGIGISKFDLFASGMVIGLVLLLALFFQKTKVGRALRAVADDHQAALSLGIPLRHHKDRLLLAERLNKLYRALTAHRQRQNRMRKEDRIANRQNRYRPLAVRLLAALGVFRCWFNYTYEIVCH